MSVKSEHRIAYGNEMFLMGIRQKHSFAVLTTAIPKQWVVFKTEFEVARTSRVTYGVICGTSANEMEYMCGVEIPSLQSAPANAAKIIATQAKICSFLARRAYFGNRRIIGDLSTPPSHALH